ncbi:MAG: polyphenol oxidase family protein [Thermoanaerobaculaceae bacterium]
MDTTQIDGVTVIRTSTALTCFADARASRPGASELELADAARVAIARILGREVSALFALQEHGAGTYLYSGDGVLHGRSHCVGVCDGLISAEPDVALVVRNADCLPVALAGGGAVAMLHAGWRGLAADILGRTVRRLDNELGIGPRELEAFIGPGVGPCHYPVGSEVTAALSRLVESSPAWLDGDRVHLAGFAVSRLRGLGVAAVEALGPCTACSPHHYSYRRDRTEAGRMWSAVVRPRS